MAEAAVIRANTIQVSDRCMFGLDTLDERYGCCGQIVKGTFRESCREKWLGESPSSSDPFFEESSWGLYMAH